ncbi:protein-L-isoaspartate(D-aspartate) O-methyltransferase [Proteiniclasticum ruminis]|uniref:Protein-L-isoaspartate O-methyltransferase n=1 Tax=Proteiniclasticum ruminis TaxID=398199 RepID=A0A1G8IA98_9CLOT|nr:protein-L-isoaspartate(D-aspartate) O-methyltransferase [Proteiniclasticum ruminis]SDI15919.1 protein-L-isoaspartate(D-aspartate) O-methyltransferase [Proteiniclasticum ruminis]
MDKEALKKYFHFLDRAYFLDESQHKEAVLDHPLPIGFGQTISQPTLVLKMTELLDLEKSHKVLEIGTGSGYQIAFLAQFAKEVYTVERIEELSHKAQKRLDGLGFKNIHYKIGDGTYGWKEEAPFDRIIVTAAAVRLPKALASQLAPGGKMVIPVGEEALQRLFLVEKDKEGYLHVEALEWVRFVSLVGEDGF